MHREEKIRLVETYLQSLLSKDLSQVLFAENVTFEGPRMPKLNGRQVVLGFLQKIMLPAVKSIQVKQHIVEESYVATIFDMETTEGLLHVCDVIHVSDGQIRGIHAFYYPEAIAR